jgi:CheY-like chemotaxis protein
LALSAQPASAANPPSSGSPLLGGHETILIAEDEDAIRSLPFEILRSQGYRVIEAVDGRDALDKCRNNNAGTRFVLTDVLMPRLSGLALYDVFRDYRQGTNVNFTSGYTAEAIEPGQAHEVHLLILPKPVRPTIPLETAHRVLDIAAPSDPLTA